MRTRHPRRFRDGRFYHIGIIYPPGQQSSGLTIRWCPSGSKETGSSWRERRHKLRLDANKIMLRYRRLLQWDPHTPIKWDKVTTVGEMWRVHAKWIKLSRRGTLRRVGTLQWWNTVAHPRQGRPGHRSEEST